jgi:hypothetical protein
MTMRYNRVTMRPQYRGWLVIPATVGDLSEIWPSSIRAGWKAEE